jgi:cephalosporin hydroxylase
MRQTTGHRWRKSSKDPYANPSPEGTEFEVDNWHLSKLVIEKIVPAAGVHPFPLNELLLMTGAIARFKPTLIFEWGTHIGKSALIFHRASQALDVDATVHSIDLPDEVEHGEHPHSQRGKLVRGIKKVELHQGDGLDTALAILKQKGSATKLGEQTLFFIDGDHSYSSVKRELAGIIKNAPKAAILLHDTFYQSPQSNYNIGPYKAINECLKAASKKYKRLDTATGLPGMTLLYPDSTDS